MVPVPGLGFRKVSKLPLLYFWGLGAIIHEVQLLCWKGQVERERDPETSGQRRSTSYPSISSQSSLPAIFEKVPDIYGAVLDVPVQLSSQVTAAPADIT